MRGTVARRLRKFAFYLISESKELKPHDYKELYRNLKRNYTKGVQNNA